MSVRVQGQKYQNPHLKEHKFGIFSYIRITSRHGGPFYDAIQDLLLLCLSCVYTSAMMPAVAPGERLYP